jgi:capsular exopolysaccharide synthesis family protein
VTNSADVQDAAGLREALGVLRRRWPLILFCVVLATGAAIGFSLLQKKQYTATSQILFQDNTFDQELFNSTVVEPDDDPQADQATNQHLVQLPIISKRTASAIGTGVTPSEVQNDMSISPVGQSNVVEISVTNPSPALAAQIANVYATQYVLFRQQSDRAQIVGAQQLIQNELARLTPQQRASSQGTSLSSRAEELKILAALQTGNAQFVQAANVPSAASIPKTKRNAILGFVVGVLLGVGLAFLLERLDRRIRSAEDLEAVFGVPVLGIVPESKAFETAPTALRLPHGEAEAFALLRARLRYFNVDRQLRSLLITSAAPQDGKSTVALNLACAEALAGYDDAILVEADMRRPTVAKRLGLGRTLGLSELLSRDIGLEDAVQRVKIAGRDDEADGAYLHVLTAGDIPPNPAELVESRAMADLIVQLTERYGLVIVDSPPAGSVSDAMHVMRLVDGVVVVSRVGKNTRDMAHHLRDQLRKLKAPVLGIVANGVSSGDRGYSGYYGYYGGYPSSDSKKTKKRERPPVGTAASD